MSTELAKHEGNEGVALYRRSSDAASICKELALKKAISIQGRKYIPVEVWQAIAIAHQCILSARDVKTLDNGWSAVGEVRRMSDGALLATAEGFVGKDEPVWAGGEGVDKYGKPKAYPKRPEYACRAMAQTRACSRAARSAFAHVVVMMDAGLETTPAEEMQGIPGHDAEEATPAKPSGPAKAPPAAQNVAAATPNAGKRPPAPPLKNVTPPAQDDLSLSIIECPIGLKKSAAKAGAKYNFLWQYNSPQAGYLLKTFEDVFGAQLEAANKANAEINICYTQGDYKGTPEGKIVSIGPA